MSPRPLALESDGLPTAPQGSACKVVSVRAIMIKLCPNNVIMSSIIIRL